MKLNILNSFKKTITATAISFGMSSPVMAQENSPVLDGSNNTHHQLMMALESQCPQDSVLNTIPIEGNTSYFCDNGIKGGVPFLDRTKAAKLLGKIVSNAYIKMDNTLSKLTKANICPQNTFPLLVDGVFDCSTISGDFAEINDTNHALNIIRNSGYRDSCIDPSYPVVFAQCLEEEDEEYLPQNTTAL